MAAQSELFQGSMDKVVVISPHVFCALKKSISLEMAI
jgi:hypothetical protein